MNNFLKVRYSLSPQLKEYDLISTDWKPYVMFFNKPDYKSYVYNLDKNGLRFNDLNANKIKPNQKIDSIFDPSLYQDFKKKGVVVGGSAAFGTGSSNDGKTIPGILSKKTDTYFFNMGCSAYNGFQEIILFQNFINHLNNLDKIIVYSGLNDMYLTYFNTRFDELFDSHYFSQIYINELNNSSISFKKKITKFIFENFTQEKIDWKNITFRELTKKILTKKKKKKQKNLNRKKKLKKKKKKIEKKKIKKINKKNIKKKKRHSKKFRSKKNIKK